MLYLQSAKHDAQNTLTVQLTFLGHLVRMRPNFQGSTMVECYRLGEMNY